MVSCFISRLNFTKRCLILAVFLFTGLSLSAQAFRNARIFVPAISGAGTAEDNAFFLKQLNYEVVLQYHSLVKTRYSSDFVLRGSIMPYTGEEQFLIDNPQEEPEAEIEPEDTGPVPPRPIPRIRNTFGRREFFSWEVDGEISFYDTTGEGNYIDEFEDEAVFFSEPEEETEEPLTENQEYVFTLELVSRMTGGVIARQYLIYGSVDASVEELVSIIVYNMLSNIPEIITDNDWRENWLFVDINAIWAPRIYTSQEPFINWVNFGLGASLEYHFLDFMSVSLGVQLVQDWIKTPGAEYRDLMLEIPVAVKFAFNTANLMMEPYGGVSFNFSLMGTTNPSLLSWFAGFQFGIKAGPGMIVIDPRFSMDFFNSTIPQRPGELYQRYLFQIAVGYKFGFLPKYPKFRE